MHSVKPLPYAQDILQGHGELLFIYIIGTDAPNLEAQARTLGIQNLQRCDDVALLRPSASVGRIAPAHDHCP